MKCSRCDGVAVSRGLCKPCYQRAWKNKTLPEEWPKPRCVIRRRPQRFCDECGDKHYCRGLCRHCYFIAVSRASSRGVFDAAPSLPKLDTAPIRALLDTWIIVNHDYTVLAERSGLTVAAIKAARHRNTIPFHTADALLTAMHRQIDEVYGYEEVAS